MLRNLLDSTVKSLNLANAFAFAPVLHFKTSKEFCPRCHTRLKVHHTDTRKIYLLDIGQCKAHRSFMYCPDCECVYPSDDFEKWVPPYANVGYDVMVLTGRLILCEHHTINETVLELKKQIVFDNLRQALSIALPGTTQRLNDTGENINMRTIEERVTQFKDNLIKTRGYHKSAAYQKLIGQLDKYWEQLFCDSIKVSTTEGDTFIQPQRTNNILEQFFRGMKRSYRRATGNNSMHKKLQSMIADTPLVKNLDNPEYIDIILDGKESIEDVLPEISQQEFVKKMHKTKNDEAKIPRNVLLLIRQKETMQKLLYLIAS